MAGSREDSATAGRQLRDRQGGLGLTLRVVGDGVFATYPLPASGEVVLGRSEKADVVIEDPSISRRHAILHIGPTLTVEDLGSANGTRIGERRLAVGERVEVASGVVIDLGSVMLMVQPGVIGNRPRRLWAHGYFEGRLDDECARAQRSGHPFAVVRVHVDGTVAAPVVEETLGAGLRAMDMVAAYGPGEYELLLLEVTPDLGGRVLEELRARLAEHGGRVAMGSAFYPRDGRTGETLIAHACAELREGGASHRDDIQIIVEDPRAQQLHRVIERVARGEVSVVLLGEPGVGKETVAELIHRRSARARMPLLRLDCGACSADQLARQLFGNFEGEGGTAGLIDRAHGGTLFLDDVGDLPAAVQDRLLRAIELHGSGPRPAARAGGDRPTLVPGRPSRPAPAAGRLDVAERRSIRFVAASTRDLEAEVRRGRFRGDLLDQLAGITLLVPPLRERAAEIEPLARAFIDRAAQHRGARAPKLSDEVLALLQRYGWPGNIRELQNVIERAVSLCDGGTITLEHLPVEKLVATLASRALAPWASPQEEPTIVADGDGLRGLGPASETPIPPAGDLRGPRKKRT
jgi:hypothetical protein